MHSFSAIAEMGTWVFVGRHVCREVRQPGSLAAVRHAEIADALK
jgi:hypothetical protein